MGHNAIIDNLPAEATFPDYAEFLDGIKHDIIGSSDEKKEAINEELGSHLDELDFDCAGLGLSRAEITSRVISLAGCGKEIAWNWTKRTYDPILRRLICTVRVLVALLVWYIESEFIRIARTPTRGLDVVAVFFGTLPMLSIMLYYGIYLRVVGRILAYLNHGEMDKQFLWFDQVLPCAVVIGISVYVGIVIDLHGPHTIPAFLTVLAAFHHAVRVTTCYGIATCVIPLLLCAKIADELLRDSHPSQWLKGIEVFSLYIRTRIALLNYQKSQST